MCICVRCYSYNDKFAASKTTVADVCHSNHILYSWLIYDNNDNDGAVAVAASAAATVDVDDDYGNIIKQCQLTNIIQTHTWIHTHNALDKCIFGTDVSSLYIRI